MLLIVFAVAAALGYRDYRRRRSAVEYLLSRVPLGVFVSMQPTNPYHDDTHDPGGTFAVAARRVRELHMEEAAVAELVVALREARVARDDKSIRGALAALQGLGPAIKAARGEVAEVVRDEGLRDDAWDLVPILAVHVLGKIAREDPEALDDLIASATPGDRSRQRIFTSSVGNEIAPFGPKAASAVPRLIAALDARPRDPHDLATFSIVAALGAIGPDAREASPRLMALARDASRADFERTQTIAAVSSILGSPYPGGPVAPTDAAPSPLIAFLDEMARDDIQDVSKAADLQRQRLRWAAEAVRRREETKLMIAADRARGGRPRPKTALAPISKN